MNFADQSCDIGFHHLFTIDSSPLLNLIEVLDSISGFPPQHIKPACYKGIGRHKGSDKIGPTANKSADRTLCVSPAITFCVKTAD